MYIYVYVYKHIYMYIKYLMYIYIYIYKVFKEKTKTIFIENISATTFFKSLLSASHFSLTLYFTYATF